MEHYTLIGPISQLLPMTGLRRNGPLQDQDLPVIENAGLLLNDKTILGVGPYTDMAIRAKELGAFHQPLNSPSVCLPGFIDSHTHSCFAGSRARDYALRNSGKTYLEIAEAGGGIWDTVSQTRKASFEELELSLLNRCQNFLEKGITTLEVKSGYGLSVAEELKMLRVIKSANQKITAALIPTCLAAHMLPHDFSGTASEYLNHIREHLFPVLLSEGLTKRIDAFIEKSAFSSEQIAPYFEAAKQMGFDLTVHADQFSTGGSASAILWEAQSADHLEASGTAEIKALANSKVVATALPGASLGLGCGFAPARALLDAGACLAIASDFNPGSAPMGDLLAQAAILGAAEKLSNAEVLAGITIRAAHALGLEDRGSLAIGNLADFVIFQTSHYNEILYHQGGLQPVSVWKSGQCVYANNTSYYGE